MKITKDCYVNVLGWTGDEVLQAAEMFAEAISGVVDDIDVRPHNGYIYLMVLESKEVFVGSSTEIVEYGRFVELTKQDIFEDRQQQQQPTEWDGEGLPPVGTVCAILGSASGPWSKGVIDYIDRKHCIWHWLDGSQQTIYDRVYNMQFRPIKSEKQKEVEELNKHLDHWFDNINDCIDNTFDVLTLSQYLYNLGYRKTK